MRHKFTRNGNIAKGLTAGIGGVGTLAVYADSDRHLGSFDPFRREITFLSAARWKTLFTRRGRKAWKRASRWRPEG